MHGRVRAPSADALDRMNRSFEYDSVSGDYARFLLDEMLPHVREDPGLNLSSDPERSRDCRQQQRRNRGVRGGLAAPGCVPPRLQRDRHLRRPARRQRVSGPHPQDRAQADPHLSAGRPERSEQLHRQLVRRQPGHAVGARVRRLRRAPRVGRRRAQLAARDRDLSAGADAGCGATGPRRSRRTRKGSRGRTSIRCSCPARSGRSSARAIARPMGRRSAAAARCSSPIRRTTAFTRSASTARSASSPRTPTAPTA